VDADTGEDAEAAFVVSVFRNFIPKDKPLDPAVNADYFYGRWATSEVRFDILDFEFQGDVDEDDTVDTEKLEDVGVWMVFINESLGRAEAFSSGGDNEEGQWFEAVECWDTSINQLALNFTVCDADPTDGSCVPAWEHDEAGLLSDCIDPFRASLEELNLPSLQTISADNPGMLEALSDVATNGIPTEAEPEATGSDAQ
ncbi:hypothetical protein KAI87_05175, partial [Myxococcota bacterium]|nr:hypothetical protein [Myxococcota bacterium]